MVGIQIAYAEAGVPVAILFATQTQDHQTCRGINRRLDLLGGYTCSDNWSTCRAARKTAIHVAIQDC